MAGWMNGTLYAIVRYIVSYIVTYHNSHCMLYYCKHMYYTQVYTLHAVSKYRRCIDYSTYISVNDFV